MTRSIAVMRQGEKPTGDPGFWVDAACITVPRGAGLGGAHSTRRTIVTLEPEARLYDACFEESVLVRVHADRGVTRSCTVDNIYVEGWLVFEYGLPGEGDNDAQ